MTYGTDLTRERLEVLSIMTTFGIDYSYQNTPDNKEWLSYLRNMPSYEYILKYPNMAKQLLDDAKGFI